MIIKKSCATLQSGVGNWEGIMSHLSLSLLLPAIGVYGTSFYVGMAGKHGTPIKAHIYKSE